MATTKTVTGFAVTGIRTNNEGSQVLVATVTYDDATTDVVEILIDRLIP